MTCLNLPQVLIALNLYLTGLILVWSFAIRRPSARKIWTRIKAVLSRRFQ